jgi:hypothetical protein
MDYLNSKQEDVIYSRIPKKQIFGPGCIKRCQFVVKVNILNQPIKWTDFRLDAVLANTMLTKLYATRP